ncbi:hypothetical protein GCM10027610_003170 [Dactylosporangium cerinum]
MVDEGLDGHPVALHDVEHAVGQARLPQQVRQEQRDRRVLLTRFEHERVAADERVGEHPHRHHRREVERGDPGDDTQGLADRVHVDAAGRLFAVTALEQVRGAGGELDVLQAAGQLTAGVGFGLAVLLADQRCDLLAVRVDELPEAEHHLGAAGQRRGPPRGERGFRAGDRSVGLLFVAATTYACCSPVAGSQTGN